MMRKIVLSEATGDLDCLIPNALDVRRTAGLLACCISIALPWPDTAMLPQHVVTCAVRKTCDQNGSVPLADGKAWIAAAWAGDWHIAT